MISSIKIAEQLNFTYISNNDTDIYTKEFNYGDTIEIVLDKTTYEVTKTVYAFPRIDTRELTEEEQYMIDARIKELLE